MASSSDGMNQVTATRGIFGLYLTLRYYREMRKNVKEEDWREAIYDTAWFGIAVAPVVAPNLVFGAGFPYVAGAALGVGTTYVVAEQLGYDTEPLTELLFDTDVRDMPKKYVEVVGPAVAETINDVFEQTGSQLAAEWDYLENKAEQGYSWGERKLEEALAWGRRGLPSLTYSF